MSWQFSIDKARTSQDYHAAAQLFEAYRASLSISLCFQDFEQEIADLGKAYPSPHGAIFLARDGDVTGGCCAIRPLADVDYANACEMKRLYVKPVFRQLGLGRDLAEAVIEFARDTGYNYLLLDTLDEMETARSLYQDLGFVEVEPYYHNPIAGAHYLMVTL
jgi:ribosomal protein S18 acetylase RimI-like enzyme